MKKDHYLNPERDQIKSLMTHDYKGAVLMLNLIKYKEKVDDMTGKEKYREYMAAAKPYIEAASGQVVFYGNPIASIIGPLEIEWDKVMIVKYENKNAFINMIKSEGYPHQIRTAAIQDSRLICIQE